MNQRYEVAMNQRYEAGNQRYAMNQRFKAAAILVAAVSVGWACGASPGAAQSLPTHRIPAALAAEAVSEAVSACARQGYRETAVVIDADGATIATLRGDGAGIHTLDSAHDKAYTSASFKNDTLAMAELAKGDVGALQKLPHVFFRRRGGHKSWR
jgi:uncharacterized protein GlcG (DUF336 family)